MDEKNDKIMYRENIGLYVNGGIQMKKSKIFISTMLMAASMFHTTVFSAEIPRESAPLNATEEQIVIVEALIGDILDEVETGTLGYLLAAGRANTRVREAVIAGETNGHGYGILSPIAQNAVLAIRDMYLRPVVYSRVENELRGLLYALLVDAANGRDITEVQKEAYERIYRAHGADVVYSGIDVCYWGDVPTIDRVYFNRARMLINEAVNDRSESAV